MNEDFERDVISIPTSETSELIYKYKCHAHPEKSNDYNYKKALYYTFREEGGVMKKLFTLDFTISLNPKNELKLDEYIKNPDIKERLTNYINDRKKNFGFTQWNGSYKFYILKDEIKLSNKLAIPRRSKQCYFTLDEIYSGKEFIKVHIKEVEYYILKIIVLLMK